MLRSSWRDGLNLHIYPRKRKKFVSGGSFYANSILTKQSPQMRLMLFVARQLLPQIGQMYFRVELGRFSGCAGGVLGSGVPTESSSVFRPMRISFQPLFSAYSTRLSPGAVFQPYGPCLKQVRPCVSAMCLKVPL